MNRNVKELVEAYKNRKETQDMTEDERACFYTSDYAQIYEIAENSEWPEWTLFDTACMFGFEVGFRYAQAIARECAEGKSDAKQFENDQRADCKN